MRVKPVMTKELSRPDVMFGVKKRSLSIKDFYDAIPVSAFVVLWTLGIWFSSNQYPDFWNHYKSAMFLGYVTLVPMTMWIVGTSMLKPRREQYREADQKYRVWLQQELKPYLESKHSIKLTGNFFTGKLMAEKDENLFEVKLFGIQHVPSYVSEDKTFMSWSHPVITGEVGLKRVDTPDAVSYSKI